MKTKFLITVAIAFFGIESGAEVFSVEKCENLMYTPRVNESVVIEACSEAWVNMVDRDYYPNY